MLLYSIFFLILLFRQFIFANIGLLCVDVMVLVNKNEELLNDRKLYDYNQISICEQCV